MLPGNLVALRSETLMIQPFLDHWLSLTFTEHFIYKPQEDCPTYLWEGDGCEQRFVSRPELINLNKLLWETVKWKTYQVTVAKWHFIHIAHKYLWKSYNSSSEGWQQRVHGLVCQKFTRSGCSYYFQDFRNGKLWQRGKMRGYMGGKPLKECCRVSYWMSELSVPASSEIVPWYSHIHHPLWPTVTVLVNGELRFRKFKTQVITYSDSNLTSLSSVSLFIMWDLNHFLEI